LKQIKKNEICFHRAAG